MKRFLSVLVLSAILFNLWGLPADTCQIKVARTENGFNIEAVAGKVYVRKGNNLDRTNYVFVTDTILEIICNDTTNVSLLNGYQKGKVSCWSQGSKGVKEDRNNWHTLAPILRRNWLVFHDINKSTDIELSLTGDNVYRESIKIRYCGNRNVEDLLVTYSTSNVRGESLRVNYSNDFSKNDTTFMAQTLSLKADEVLTQFSLNRSELKEIMKVEEMLLDGNNLSFTVSFKNNIKNQNEDDIMFSTEIVPDSLLHKVLKGGSHTVSFKCTMLTKDGPKKVTINIPIEVKKNNIPVWCWYIFALILLFLLVWFYKKKKRNRKNKKSDNPEEVIFKDDSEGENSPKEQKRSMLSLVKGCLIKSSTRKKEINQDEQNTPQVLSEDLEDKNFTPETGNFGSEQGKAENRDFQLNHNSKEKEEVEIKIKKENTRSIIEEWNSRHPENQVDRSQMTLDFLFNTIERGYIGAEDKNIIENKKKNLQLDVNTTIKTLIEEIYKRGHNDGACEAQRESENSYKSKEKEYSSKIDELVLDNNELQNKCNGFEQDNKALSSKVSSLEKQNNDLSNKSNDLEQSNKKFEIENDNLKKQVNAQSLEHVEELEIKIKQLNEDIAKAHNAITDKESELDAKQKELEKQIRKKEDLENRFNEIKAQLDESEAKHRYEIKSLREGHKAACLELKDSFKSQLSIKEQEIAQLLKNHKSAMDEKQVELEAELAKLRDKNAIDLQMLVEAHKLAIDKLNNEHEVSIDKLNTTINELGVSVNVGRNETISRTDGLLMAIDEKLKELDSSVNNIVVQLPIFASLTRNILTDMRTTRETFDYFKKEVWTSPDTLQAQVIQDMQEIYINAMGRSGWINNVARLLSYSRLPVLKDGTDLPSQLELHGVSSALMECIYADLSSLLGIADMGLIVPAVLANNYNIESYEYTNGDTWIDKFFPDVSIRNYKGKVFDIVQVGYVIGGKTIRKPDVQYN